jgi:hypothetical protein
MLSLSTLSIYALALHTSTTLAWSPVKRQGQQGADMGGQAGSGGGGGEAQSSAASAASSAVSSASGAAATSATSAASSAGSITASSSTSAEPTMIASTTTVYDFYFNSHRSRYMCSTSNRFAGTRYNHSRRLHFPSNRIPPRRQFLILPLQFSMGRCTPEGQRLSVWMDG